MFIKGYFDKVAFCPRLCKRGSHGTFKVTGAASTKVLRQNETDIQGTHKRQVRLEHTELGRMKSNKVGKWCATDGGGF